MVEQSPLKRRVVGSIPTGRTKNGVSIGVGRGGEMADTLALGASAARHGGSSPLPGTTERSDVGRGLKAGARRREAGSRKFFSKNYP